MQKILVEIKARIILVQIALIRDQSIVRKKHVFGGEMSEVVVLADPV